MNKPWALGALIVLVSFSSARSVCQDLNNHLDVPVPLGSDTTIQLDVATIECEPLDDDGELEEIVVSGGTLTLSSISVVRFLNVRFTVEDGASLVFDMPETQFGPTEEQEGGYFMIDVEQGGSVTFLGKTTVQGVKNVFAIFRNAGNIEFKSDALFQENGNVFRFNSGTIKFRSDTIFKDNSYLALQNESGFVRFSKTVLFDDNGSGFEGGQGCAVGNFDAEGVVIFRDTATFINHYCQLGAAVFNSGKMRFYGKARFEDNRSFEDGGTLVNKLGNIEFRAAAQFNRNRSESLEGEETIGGALTVQGGDVTFKKGVLFDSNDTSTTGGAFCVTYGEIRRSDGTYISGSGTLTFKKPSATRFRNNTNSATEVNSLAPACTVGYVEDGSTLIGYPDDDVCMDKFS